MIETDGPYGGYSCQSKNHSHHRDEYDSIYWQNEIQKNFYMKMRELEVYVNQPDNYFYSGGSRSAMGYNEHQFSLPRWMDVSISRQGMFDDMITFIPTQGWMFLPIQVYHEGGSAAAFEPLNKNLQEYEWGLAQYMGAGVAAAYRGNMLYDTQETKAVVKKWVDFYKRYRDIIISDIIHVRRGDMQSIDSFMHVNPSIENKALAMVFNPTDDEIRMDLTLPLYYTGLTNDAYVSIGDDEFKKYTLSRNYEISVPIGKFVSKNDSKQMPIMEI